MIGHPDHLTGSCLRQTAQAVRWSGWLVFSIIADPFFKRKVSGLAQSEFAKLKEHCERDVEYIESSNNG